MLLDIWMILIYDNRKVLRWSKMLMNFSSFLIVLCNINSRSPKSSVSVTIAQWWNHLLVHTSDHPLGPESPAPTWRYTQPSPLRPALITCATCHLVASTCLWSLCYSNWTYFQNRLLACFFDWLYSLAFSFWRFFYTFLFSSFVL